MIQVVCEGNDEESGLKSASGLDRFEPATWRSHTIRTTANAIGQCHIPRAGKMSKDNAMCSELGQGEMQLDNLIDPEQGQHALN